MRIIFRTLIFALVFTPSPALAQCNTTNIYELTRRYYGAVYRYDSAKQQIILLASDLSFCRGKKGIARNLAQEYIGAELRDLELSYNVCDYPQVETYALAAETTAYQYWQLLSTCEAK